MVTTGEKMSMEVRYPRTISLELYDAWQIMRRSGDPGKLHDKLKISRPIIDRALNYGNVKKTGLADKITKFFNDRFEAEKTKGTNILQSVKGE